MVQSAYNQLVRPENVEYFEQNNGRSAKVVVSPLQRGFGTTVGNAMRRVLLSSIRGVAVESIKVAGVIHEFSSINGVKEDVTDIVLNVRSLELKMDDLDAATATIKVTGPKVVTASDINVSSGVKVLNPNLVLFTIENNTEVNIELAIRAGIGYVPVTHESRSKADLGTILLDCFFSPIKSVAFEVDSARVGQYTDYESLVMNIETNGSIVARDALAIACAVIRDFMKVFVNFDEKEFVKRKEKKEDSFNYNLLQKIDALELSVRSQNCLRNENIIYVGELVKKSEMDMLKTPNFGRKSLDELKQVLATMKLGFGVDVEWPPKNMDELLSQMKSESSAE